MKGDLYEYMLGKLTTAGIAGQFRTPRHIIAAMVQMLDPKPTELVGDPACGTAGFLVEVMLYLLKKYTSEKMVWVDEEGQKHYPGDLLESHRDHIQIRMFNGFDFDQTMLRIVELASAGSQITRLEYHLEYGPTEEYFRGKLKNVLLRFLKILPNANLRFIRWRSFEQFPRDAMHPRYILTDLGGIRYDYGLCEGNAGETTDVQIIPKGSAVYEQRWADFSASSTCFEFVDGFEVSARGVSELSIRDGLFQIVR